MTPYSYFGSTNYSDATPTVFYRAGFVAAPGTAAALIPAAVLPQFQPYPPLQKCEPARPSTGHAAGIVVGMGDVSVKIVSKNVSVSTWWASATPGARDRLGADW
jgi:hypothetical protein